MSSELLLLDRSNNTSALLNVRGNRGVSAYPIDSPFKHFIKGGNNGNKYYIPRTSISPVVIKMSSDGMFPVTKASNGPKNDILWEYSTGLKLSKHMSDTKNVVWQKETLKEVIPEEDETKAPVGAEAEKASMFLPAIFKKIAAYQQKVLQGLSPDPDTILSDAEKNYVKTINTTDPAFRAMLEELSKTGMDVNAISQALNLPPAPAAAAAAAPGAAAAAAPAPAPVGIVGAPVAAAPAPAPAPVGIPAAPPAVPARPIRPPAPPPGQKKTSGVRVRPPPPQRKRTGKP